MSLATRCTACATVFRVVQDQLKVSEGWVRCGRCDQVFNAMPSLFDLERDAPPPDLTVPEITTGNDAPGVSIFSGALDESRMPVASGAEPERVNRVESWREPSRPDRFASTPATRIDERDRLEFPDAQFDSELIDQQPAASDGATDGWPARDSGTPFESGANSGVASTFDRNRRLAMPRPRRGWHALQRVAAVMLATLLALQALHHFRHAVVAGWPGVEPIFTAWCRLADCRLEAPRRIDDIAVESTALTRVPARDAFKLAVALRNRGALPVALPSVDLSLTDATGQLVARRMLAPRDFLAPSSAVAAGADLALQLVLTVPGARVTGYTVEVFYP